MWITEIKPCAHGANTRFVTTRWAMFFCGIGGAQLCYSSDHFENVEMQLSVLLQYVGFVFLFKCCFCPTTVKRISIFSDWTSFGTEHCKRSSIPQEGTVRDRHILKTIAKFK